jgi:hypothetical protein
VELSVVKTKAKVFLSSLLAAVILLLAIFWGAAAGKETAQSITLTKIAQNLIFGLQYFYSDQNRFPTALEFSDQNIMLNYFSGFPAVDFPSKLCPQSFVYKRVAADNAQLSFCLPRAAGDYGAGFNMLNVSPPAQNQP